MSNLVFPSSLPGMDISITREPLYATKTLETLTRKELRSTWETFPRYRYRVDFNILRADSLYATRAREWQEFFHHLAKMLGSWDSFLLTDPDDSSVTDHGFAACDGITTQFQLQRSLAGDVIDASGFQYTFQSKPYTNLLKNSGFETDTNADGLADNWGAYNNSSATEPTVATIIPGLNGGKAQRVSWGTNNTSQKGVTQSGASPVIVAGQWYTISCFVRASGSNIGKFIGLANNAPAPNQKLVISCPALTGNWQRYLFQVFWNIGTSPSAEVFISIANTNDGQSLATSTFGDLDFDLVQIVAGQHGVNDFQPLETPAAATGVDTPSYYPLSGDGFEPIFDLNGSPTVYLDGDWQGRRQLYPYTRTNYLAFSEAFDNAAWVPSAVTVVANTTTAPDGTSTAEKMVDTVATSEHFLEQTGIYRTAAIAGTLMRISVYCKPAGRNWLYLATVLRDDVTVKGTFFNVSTGAIGGSAAGVTAAISYAGNGWYRCSVVINVGTGPGATYPSVRCKVTTGDGVSSHTGDGASGLYLWGAMAEIVSNTNPPTQYIKTPSSAAVTVTDYSISASGLVTFPTAPPANTFLSADMNYYRRVRFEEDNYESERIALLMWRTKSVNLISVKP